MFTVGGLRAEDTAASAADLAFFESKIRPVLVEHCYACHSAQAKQVRGKLLLDTRAGARRGGESGPAVTPGKPDESLLLSALRHESFEMPPDQKLSDSVIADFETWIRRGAADPRAGDATVGLAAIDVEVGRKFWSFQPLHKAAPPEVADTSWPRTDIDRFVLAKLEAAHVHPGPDADDRTLIRRVYFDLLGLPPTPEEMQRAEDEAFETLVDRLLDSPHFGERWGRHWLDVVRYADSTGGGRTRILHDAWRYRDYVIRAFNEGRPFDRFIEEQIAGDLLPYTNRAQRVEQLTATTFLALGPTNYEEQDKELLRMEVVDEQLDTVGRAFLGMTIGCARCHDHKFDPIPTRDYYALAGIFRNTKTLNHANVSNWIERQLPVDPAWQAALDAHQAAVNEMTAKLNAAKQLVAQAGSGEFDLQRLPGIVIDDAQALVAGDWRTSRSVRTYLGEHYLHDEAVNDGASSVTYRPAFATAGEYEVRISYTASTNRAAQAPITVRGADGERTIRVDQREKPAIGGVFHSLGSFRFQAGTAGAVVISNDDARGQVIADAVQFLPVETSSSQAEINQPSPSSRQAARDALAKLEEELAALKKRAPPSAPQVMSVEEEQQVVDCPLHVRGNVHNLGEAVPRGFLSVAEFGWSPEFSDSQSGRRELAHWIAHRDNPLTARVAVNRIWLHLLGEGLVRTPDTFGTTGEAPSHPELLDYLAARFIESGWSTKALIREIVLSRVYQLSSAAQPDLSAADPDNRWLARANRRRLDAEAIRDAMLSVSGRLDLTAEGTLIDPRLDSEFGYEYRGSRRSVYVPVFRNELDGLFEVFDVADPNLVTGRRNVSTLPTQALYLMNSPFVMQQAQTAAKRVLAEDVADVGARAVRLYELALGRPPTPRELELTLRHVEAKLARPSDQDSEIEAWTSVFQSLFACLDFRYVR